jgi:hypothetical protein
MNAVVNRSSSDVTTALARWYADHASIRRLWAVEDSTALVVFVALEPSSDGDDSLPTWLANQHGWAQDLRRVTQRDVHLQLIVSGVRDEPDIDADTVMIAELSWRDSWESL